MMSSMTVLASPEGTNVVKEVVSAAVVSIRREGCEVRSVCEVVLPRGTQKEVVVPTKSGRKLVMRGSP